MGILMGEYYGFLGWRSREVYFDETGIYLMKPDRIEVGDRHPNPSPATVKAHKDYMRYRSIVASKLERHEATD